MKIKSRLYKNSLYIMLIGELDEYTAEYTRNTLDELFDKNKFLQVIIDLSEMTFMDSTGVGVLIGRYKKLVTKDIPIFISNPSKHAEKIFKMAGLYDIMPLIS